MRAAVIIPARLASTRFPGKVLAPLHGRPLIQHVWERATGSSLASEVIVATDSENVLEVVEGFGGRAVMTSPEHPSGTDRVAEAARGLGCDIIVNVQGDEPLIRAEVIDLAVGLMEDERASMGTVASPLREPSEIADPNVVKVVTDLEGFAMYFSRAPIPYRREDWAALADAGRAEAKGLFKHIGIYSYRMSVLQELTALAPSPLERTEKLEQLRALEHGVRIKVGVTDFDSHGVDTPEDLERVKRISGEV
jgi:3-deoxy-manno-octulosonate cytidylyltransferase (CMP-KDO synthetase)